MTTEVKDEFEMLLEESFAKSNTVADIVEGTVIKKEILPSERYDADLLKGEYVKTELPEDEYVDILLTIEASANITEQNISIGDYIIKVGEQAFVKGKGYASIGYVVSIER